MKNLLLLSVTLLFMACREKNDSMYLLVGSYSNGKTPGISVYDFNLQDAGFNLVAQMTNISNPSYLAVSRDEKTVYSVNETGSGAVSAFRFDKATGSLHFVNSQPAKGANPCYISIDKKQKILLTANYSGGNISVFPLSDNGEIHPVSQLIDLNSRYSRLTSYMHTAVFSPDQKYVFATDLGKDRILRFKVDLKNPDKKFLKEKGYPIIMEKGSGPRHIDFHPKKNMLTASMSCRGK